MPLFKLKIMERDNINKKLFIAGNVLSNLAIKGIMVTTVCIFGSLLMMLIVDYRERKLINNHK